MATYKDVLAIAEKEVGVTECPAGSNNVKYNTKYYGGEVFGTAYQWCLVFCWYCFNQANASELFYGGQKTASCSTLMSYGKKHGNWVVSNYQPGDILFMNFSGKSNPQHAGIVVSVDENAVHTIEGNTSSSKDGSQSNGGAVARKTRPLSVIVGAYRPLYDSDKKREDKKVMIEARQIRKGSTGDAVRVLQAALNALQHSGLIVDGDFGALTEKALKQYQSEHKTVCGTVDGICGKKTWESLLS